MPPGAPLLPAPPPAIPGPVAEALRALVQAMARRAAAEAFAAAARSPGQDSPDAAAANTCEASGPD